MSDRLLDPDAILCGLKDFQRRTVDYVFRRMYLDASPAQRFLVADEVGLGKTLVARGILARAIEHLGEKGVDRIDIVYVCSNAAIAAQNINRLNVTGDRHLAKAMRLTLLPTWLGDLTEKRLNFVSFTPGTTFDLKSRGGIVEERLLLLKILQGWRTLPRNALKNLMQGTCDRDNFRQAVRQKHGAQKHKVNDDLAQDFLDRLSEDSELNKDLEEALDLFRDGRRKVTPHASELRWGVIGRLRQTLAEACVKALEPDVVILDEFQRFRHLLEQDNEAAWLAQRLFQHQDEKGGDVRVLLLSATPYQMLSLHGEEDEHYGDFLQTLRFLYGSEEEVKGLEQALDVYRTRLYGVQWADEGQIKEARDEVQGRLQRVMCRMERVPSTLRRDAMLTEPDVGVDLQRRDLEQAVTYDELAQSVGAGDIVEYWKSAPYLLNFMKDYDLSRRCRDSMTGQGWQILSKDGAGLLHREQLESYEPVDPANGRLRRLLRDEVHPGQWRLLWVPPSLPYVEPAGAYAELAGHTKSLIFSSWNLVPDAVASLVSYEAERLMLTQGDQKPPRYSELLQERRPLLRFSLKDDQPAGMTSLVLLYPSATLAAVVDPLVEACRTQGGGSPVAQEDLLRAVQDRLEAKLRRIGCAPRGGQEGPADRRWYWAAPAILDAYEHPYMERFVKSGSWRAAPDETERDRAFAEHVRFFGEYFSGPTDLGRRPEDLTRVLAELALGSPAVCALRALRRIVSSPEFSRQGIIDAGIAENAAVVASGFRSLFNLPESIAIVQGGDAQTPYWRNVVRYGIEGNLQATLDEYLHLLRELRGLIDHPASTVVSEVAEVAAEASSLRTSSIKMQEAPDEPDGEWRSDFSIRCRFALRFGDVKDTQGTALQRASNVRESFNSPFRPFVLASTSIGQEGLDFHPYCHAVYHWNLPSNPVDLEQREGRIHRYKGHAIRKNIAARQGLTCLASRWDRRSDPWDVLFTAAAEERPSDVSELIPYWIYETEGGAQVERRVPLLPFSRDQAKLKRIKRDLAVYRMAFGQPRQEDLLEHLEECLGDECETRDFSRWMVSLAPPQPPE